MSGAPLPFRIWLDAFFAAPETDAEAIDRTLAEHFLTIQTWEYTSAHFQRGNASVYTGEAIFGVIALFLTRSRLSMSASR